MSVAKISILDSCVHKIALKLHSIIEELNLNCNVRVFECCQNVLELINQENPDLIFWIVDEVKSHEKVYNHQLPSVPLILVPCANGSVEQVFNFFIDKIDDYIITPLRETDVIYRISRFIERINKEEKELVKRNLLQKLGMLQIIGQDPAFLEVISKISLISDCNASVLIRGETGVGKEVCARAIHYLSKRSDNPFIPVSCGAIPSSLVENELFGHQRGAFTDAHRNQFGIVSEAEKGTLFLDEIDTLSLEVQSKLLRLLQDKTYRPLGHARNLKANIRIVAATNMDLREKSREGAFREDLFYRLNVISLHLPPLRKRKSDIPLLANHFLKKYSNEFDRKMKSLSPASIKKLMLYDWPGNIRELENIIQQAVLFTTKTIIPPENINIPVSVHFVNSGTNSFKEEKKRAIEKFEKNYITHLLISCDGNITKAAKKAKKDRRDFSRLMQKYQINANFFRNLHL